MSPEIGLLFHNTKGEPVRFSEANDASIDELVQASMLEFLSDDLAAVTEQDRNTGGLLG